MYKFVCKDLSVKDTYVGSSTDFRKRKNRHKCCCLNPQDKNYNLKIYQIIRENGGWDNWDMIEIEKYPCKDGNEARARENHLFKELNASMNTFLPQHIHSEYNKAYREANKEEIKIQKKAYYETNKEAILEKSKIRDKAYWEANKEQILERRKERRKKAKETKI
jgi:hypothetical protein